MGSSFDSEMVDDYASLTSDVGEYVFENGRRYHGYKAGRYPMPNDEKEMDREDMKHHVYLLLTQGQLHLAPIGPDPETILDIGTGTGIWAIDMADTYPNARVIATDLSPIQPTWVPPNMVIEIDDAEDEWLYRHNSMDFVHARFMFMGIRNWPKLVQQAKQALKPGGWIELADLDATPGSYGSGFPERSQILEWTRVMVSVGKKAGLDLGIAPKFKPMLEDAGYVDVQEVVLDLPVGEWPKDKRMNEAGRFHKFQLNAGLPAIGTALLTRMEGWSKDRVEVFQAGVRSELNDNSIQMYYRFYITFGRKPDETDI